MSLYEGVLVQKVLSIKEVMTCYSHHFGCCRRFPQPQSSSGNPAKTKGSRSVM
jgi:hypothetical protein